MELEVGIITQYFDIFFDKKKEDIKITLKDSFKREGSPKRSDGRPYGGACIEYYRHHLGNDAEKVYDVRRVFLTPYNRLLFGLQYFQEDSIKKILSSKLENIQEKSKQKFKDPNWVGSWKAKLKEAVTDQKKATLSKNAKDNWNKKEYRQKQSTSERREQRSSTMKSLWNSEGFREKWMEGIQSEVRKEKIRQHSIKKWEYARESDLELYYRMSHSSINKHHKVHQKPATSIEFKMSGILEKVGYVFVFDQPITHDNKTYRPDFYIPSLNLIVECYGDYWHANPEMYEESALIFRNITAKDIWVRDEERKNFYCRCGYNFVYFYQSEMIEELILNKIKEYERK